VVYDKNSASEKICSTPYCYLYGSSARPAKIDGEITYGEYAIETAYVGGSASYDMALLRANTADVLAINENVKAVTFAKDYKVGETAIAIGNPEGEGISVTKGIVSVDSELISLAVDGTSRDYRSMRMDTSIYGGNSGGGLFNAYGELIGLVNAKSTENDNMTYAIPLPRVLACAQNLMANRASKKLQTLTFGVTTKAQNSKYVYDSTKGYGSISEQVAVQEVAQNSLAESMGLQAGDILTSLWINETEYPLTRYYQLSEYRLYIQTGDRVKFTYLRDDEQKETNSITATTLSAID
jgi:serine protease Do